MEKELLKRIDTYKPLVIDLQTHMIACPAVSPHEGGDGEDAKAAYLLSVLKQISFYYRLSAYLSLPLPYSKLSSLNTASKNCLGSLTFCWARSLTSSST